MRLAPDESVLAFRRQFEAWLDEHLRRPHLMAKPQAVVGPPARVGARLPAGPVRGGLPRAGVATRARWLQRDPPGADDLLRGHHRAPGATLAQPARPLHLRRLHRENRNRGPEGAIRPAHLEGRDDVVPRHERAQHGQRPRLAHHESRTTRRPLRGERAEGVDLGGPRGRLLHVLRPHRSRETQAPWHQCDPHRHAHAGHHVPPAARADRSAPRRLQRGLLHRRRGARGEPPRRVARRVDREPGLPASRAGGCSGS